MLFRSDWYNSSASTRTMFLDNSGNVTFAGNVTAYSDGRLKTNVKSLENSLQLVKQLRGVSYNWIESGEYAIGVIAQEVEKVLPQIVKPAPFDIDVDDDGNEYSRSGENYKTVKYEKLVPLLIEAIKELKDEINELKGGK